MQMRLPADRARAPVVRTATVPDSSPQHDKLWQSMRILRINFTVAHLSTVAEVPQSTAMRLVRLLLNTGFLRQMPGTVGGRAGNVKRYAIARDTGPRCPVKRKNGGGMLDRNTGLAWTSTGEPVPAAATKRRGAVNA